MILANQDAVVAWKAALHDDFVPLTLQTLHAHLQVPDGLGQRTQWIHARRDVHGCGGMGV
eukprot:537769-Pelagomonas_calceolata.AAC.3